MGLTMDLDDLLGAAEAAELAGLKGPKAVHTYVHRGVFPAPVKRLGTCDGWRRQDIEAWREARSIVGHPMDTGG
jgi:predicted DNA-binding transcriptional regulator AlpA